MMYFWLYCTLETIMKNQRWNQCWTITNYKITTCSQEMNKYCNKCSKVNNIRCTLKSNTVGIVASTGKHCFILISTSYCEKSFCLSALLSELIYLNYSMDFIYSLGKLIRHEVLIIEHFRVNWVHIVQPPLTFFFTLHLLDRIGRISEQRGFLKGNSDLARN